jgi:hypothetical protein
MQAVGSSGSCAQSRKGTPATINTKHTVSFSEETDGPGKNGSESQTPSSRISDQISEAPTQTYPKGILKHKSKVLKTEELVPSASSSNIGSDKPPLETRPPIEEVKTPLQEVKEKNPKETKKENRVILDVPSSVKRW